MASGGQGLDDLLSKAEVERLRDVLEDRDDAVLSLADEGYAILWATRPGSRGMFGREDEQYQGMDAREFIHPAEVPDWERAFARALAGETVRWEGNVLRGDGSWLRVASVMWRTQASREVLGVTRPIDEPFGL
jgi:PAS domain S-box-containing protein